MNGKISVKHKLVSELMSSPVKSMNPMMSVHDAIAFLIDNKISGAPLINHQNELISIVTELDLMKIGALEGTETLLGEAEEKLPKKENLITIAATASFVSLFKIFLEKNVRRVIVVDEKNHPVGIVARRDIIRAYLKTAQ